MGSRVGRGDRAPLGAAGDSTNEPTGDTGSWGSETGSKTRSKAGSGGGGIQDRIRWMAPFRGSCAQGVDRCSGRQSLELHDVDFERESVVERAPMLMEAASPGPCTPLFERQRDFCAIASEPSLEMKCVDPAGGDMMVGTDHGLNHVESMFAGLGSGELVFELRPLERVHASSQVEFIRSSRWQMRCWT
jgi:hypothetical protein